MRSLFFAIVFSIPAIATESTYFDCDNTFYNPISGQIETYCIERVIPCPDDDPIEDICDLYPEVCIDEDPLVLPCFGRLTLEEVQMSEGYNTYGSNGTVINPSIGVWGNRFGLKVSIPSSSNASDVYITADVYVTPKSKRMLRLTPGRLEEYLTIQNFDLSESHKITIEGDYTCNNESNRFTPTLFRVPMKKTAEIELDYSYKEYSHRGTWQYVRTYSCSLPYQLIAYEETVSRSFTVTVGSEFQSNSTLSTLIRSSLTSGQSSSVKETLKFKIGGGEYTTLLRAPLTILQDYVAKFHDFTGSHIAAVKSAGRLTIETSDLQLSYSNCPNQ